MTRFSSFTILSMALLFAVFTQSSNADGHPTVNDLAWMTGSWDGEGPNVLEENWSLPRAGTMASLVRSTAPDGTKMVEIVYIEEADGTLVLYLQQWDPGFKPRTSEAQKMIMSEMGERSITFVATNEGGLKRLKYSRPSEDQFHVDVTIATDQQFVIKLKTQQR